MIVKSSDIIFDYTVITLTDQIPHGAFYVVFDGEKHKMFPVYGIGNTMTFGIKGAFELTGKNVTFAGREDNTVKDTATLEL